MVEYVNKKSVRGKQNNATPTTNYQIRLFSIFIGLARLKYNKYINLKMVTLVCLARNKENKEI